MLFLFYKTKQENNDVTNKYVSIIRKSLIRSGNECRDVDFLQDHKDEYNIGVVTIDVFHTLEAKKRGYAPIIFWVQGLCPEESFLRRQSKIRKFILSEIERRALVAADFVLFVSNNMRVHFKNKYGFETDRQYIMPCFSEELSDKSFFKDRYMNNTFLYAGRLSVWQCFEETVQLYKQIEERFINTNFLVMTHQQQEAEHIIGKYNLKNFKVSYAESNQFAQAIRYCKFGFCLRKKNDVNLVATPTKFSDYISNGIIPIYSKNTEDFYIRAKNNPFCLCIENKNFWDKIEELCCKEIDDNQVLRMFFNSFGDYYSSDCHIDKLTVCLSSLKSDFSI